VRLVWKSQEGFSSSDVSDAAEEEKEVGFLGGMEITEV
jgi:hypothetical protein